MNREILFRGKRLDNGKWVFGDLLTKHPHHKGLTIVENGVLHHEVDPETVGKYTGLKDKNGVKIFEGDYIYHHWHKDTAYLVWHERYICFVGRPFEGDTSKTYHYQKPDEPDLEVIGNIHDNPELLEV